MLVAEFHFKLIIFADPYIAVICQGLVILVEQYAKCSFNCNEAIKGRDEKMAAAYCWVKHTQFVNDIAHLPLLILRYEAFQFLKSLTLTS